MVLPGLRMVRAQLESYISVNQHLEMMIQEDWSLLSLPKHGGPPGACKRPWAEALGHEASDSDRSWGLMLGVGWPGLQFELPLVKIRHRKIAQYGEKSKEAAMKEEKEAASQHRTMRAWASRKPNTAQR